MRSVSVISFALLVIGCTSTVPVTNDPNNSSNGGTANNGTAAGSSSGSGGAQSRLAAALYPKCQQICAWMVTCPGVASSCSCDDSAAVVPAGGSATVTTRASSCSCTSGFESADECMSGCFKSLGDKFLFQGEACAEIGIGLLDCYGQLNCNSLQQNQKDPCGTSAAQSVCSDDSTLVEAPTTSRPVPDSGTAASGGSASTGAPGSAGGTMGGSPVTGGPGTGGATAISVSCTTDNAMGKAPVNGVNGAQPNEQLCESTRSNCSDGHEYRISCGTTQDLVVMCQCIFDGHVQVSFEDAALLSSDPSRAACNDTATLNEKCGWSLVGSTGIGDPF